MEHGAPDRKHALKRAAVEDAKSLEQSLRQLRQKTGSTLFAETAVIDRKSSNKNKNNNSSSILMNNETINHNSFSKSNAEVARQVNNIHQQVAKLSTLMIVNYRATNI